jgi:hypothetical protein
VDRAETPSEQHAIAERYWLVASPLDDHNAAEAVRGLALELDARADQLEVEEPGTATRR